MLRNYKEFYLYNQEFDNKDQFVKVVIYFSLSEYNSTSCLHALTPVVASYILTVAVKILEFSEDISSNSNLSLLSVS